MRIIADREQCASAGMCALTAPAVFDQDEVDGRVVVLNENPVAEDARVAADAVHLCPSGALSTADE